MNPMSTLFQRDRRFLGVLLQLPIVNRQRFVWTESIGAYRSFFYSATVDAGNLAPLKTPEILKRLGHSRYGVSKVMQDLLGLGFRVQSSGFCHHVQCQTEL